MFLLPGLQTIFGARLTILLSSWTHNTSLYVFYFTFKKQTPNISTCTYCEQIMFMGFVTHFSTYQFVYDGGWMNKVNYSFKFGRPKRKENPVQLDFKSELFIFLSWEVSNKEFHHSLTWSKWSDILTTQ